MDRFHEPVLVQEVLHYLAPGPGQLIADCTLGSGSHAEAVLSWVGPGEGQVGMVLGIDRDPEALAEARQRLKRFGSRARVVKGNFNELKDIIKAEGIEKMNGILLDLGASRHQLTAPGRGFGLRAEGPLDMRMDPEETVTAGELLARLDERALSGLIREYGEERQARRIARAVVERRAKGRAVQTTRELAELVEAVLPKGEKSRLHPATKTFMALRIAVNRELERLAQVLAELPDCLATGGRAVVISYHSLEDRLVKQAFALEAKGCVCPPGLPVCACGKKPRLTILTRRPVQPEAAEVLRNPAARSAKLRAAERREDLE